MAGGRIQSDFLNHSFLGSGEFEWKGVGIEIIEKPANPTENNPLRLFLPLRFYHARFHLIQKKLFKFKAVQCLLVSVHTGREMNGLKSLKPGDQPELVSDFFGKKFRNISFFQLG